MIDLIKDLMQLRIFLGFLTFLLIFIGVKVKINVVKHILFNVAAIVFCLLIYEGVILNEKKIITEILGSYSSDYYGTDSILGYGPKKDTTITSTKLINGDTIYNVKYTIKNRIRETPNSYEQSNNFRIFIGCSQTFGEGLNNNETLPFYFNELSNKRFNIRNYSFHGYGSHQAFAIVENILFKDSVLLSNSENVIVFYNFYYVHIARAAGYSSWDHVGPRYEVEDGILVYQGSLATKYYRQDSPNIIVKAYQKIWEKSNIYKNHFGGNNQITKYDIQRTLLILKNMNDQLSEKGMRFILILNTKAKEDKTIENFLLSNKIESICLECDIPDREDNMKYRIHEKDQHATKIFNEQKAKILIKTID